jgi:hypothetical protein
MEDYPRNLKEFDVRFRNEEGAVSHKHLDYYLDEFTFRFNRRRSKNRGKLFFDLVQQALVVELVFLARILRPEPTRNHNL